MFSCAHCCTRSGRAQLRWQQNNSTTTSASATSGFALQMCFAFSGETLAVQNLRIGAARRFCRVVYRSAKFNGSLAAFRTCMSWRLAVVVCYSGHSLHELLSLAARHFGRFDCIALAMTCAL